MSPRLLTGATECVTQIAAATKSPEAIQALLAVNKPAVTLALATNVNLSQETRSFLRKGAKVDMLAALAKSATGDEQIQEVLTSKSSKVLDVLYSGGVKGASSELTNKLIDLATPLQIYTWLNSDSWPEGKLLVKALEKSHFSWSHLDDPRLVGVLTHAQAMRIVKKFITDPDNAGSYCRLNACLDVHPELLPAFAQVARGKKDYPAMSAIFEALFNTRHIFDQKLYSSLIKASSRLSKKDRCRLLSDLSEHPNMGVDATYEIYLIFAYDETIKRAAKDYVSDSFQYHYDKKLKRLAVVNVDWSIVQSPQQRRTIRKYRALWHGEYPTLDLPAAYKERVAIGSKPPRYHKVDLAKVMLQDNTLSIDEEGDLETLDGAIFERQVLPELKKFGVPGLLVFFQLTSGWKASVAELIHTTVATVS